MMRVSQTGHDSVSMQVHDSSVLAGVLLRVTIGTDKDYSVTLYRDRFRARLVLVDRVDVAILKNQVSCLLPDTCWAESKQQTGKY